MTKCNKKALYFGIYSTGAAYPRNRNIIESMRDLGWDIKELHFEMAEDHDSRQAAAGSLWGAVRFGLLLLKSYWSLSRALWRALPADAVIVGHPGYFHIHLAKLLCRFRRPRPVLVYDIFIPLYNTLVEDREMMVPGSLSARLLHRFEKSCCAQADINLMDTGVHSGYIADEFDVPGNKLLRVFVGSPMRIDDPPSAVRASDGKIRVAFVGTYIPLHGIETIIEAAASLKSHDDMHFTLVGRGQLRSAMQEKAEQLELNNLEFIDWIETDSLGQFISEQDLMLGVFGKTAKSQRVIPTKAFDVCLLGKPLVSADSPAMREAFAHKENAYLVPAGDPAELAAAILELASDPQLLKKLAEGAAQTHRDLFNPQRLAKPLAEAIDSRSTTPPL